VRIRLFPILASLAALLPLVLVSCTTVQEPDVTLLAGQPLTADTRVRHVDVWSFDGRTGAQIATDHFRIRTTMDDPVFQHLLVRVVEAAFLHNRELAKYTPDKSLDCYVFASRDQWETYTRAQAGSNAPIYLQISSGGYCQEGVFAGYDLGRRRTLSVVAHETWHQYSWFAFKSRLPSWLEEGLAAQNEAIAWDGDQPVFRPELNTNRQAALRQALRAGTLWPLSDLLSTHAGRVIKMPQPSIDAYYAQLWSLVLFLRQSPVYSARLEYLLADARAGRLTSVLVGTSVTQREIDNFTEHWNSVAGPLYLRRYLAGDLDALQREYLAWARQQLAVR
jgi:hypothetical protein